MPIDDVIRDRGDGRMESDPTRVPAEASETPAGERRSADHNEVDTPAARDDGRVEPPALGGAARTEDDLLPFEVTKSPVDVKAELEDAGLIAGLLSLLG